MKQFFALLLVALFLSPRAAHAVDLAKIEQDLKGPGVTGWIHGSVADRNLFVFTYRTPGNFFDFIEMSLTAEDAPEMQAKIATFGRHDKVLVKGNFLKNPSPQKHINVKSIELVEKYQDPYKRDSYRYEAKIPDDLLKGSRATFLVHAVAGDGAILVLEYKDQVVPVFVKKPELTKNLFRGDVIELAYLLQENPDSPAHLNLDEKAANPLVVKDSVVALHGKPAALDGELVLFPKSPEIIFNVFALLQHLDNGLTRQYTLVNFDDPALFKKIREKLQAEWDKFPAYVNGRNKLVNTKVRVRAKGTFNEIDPGQANPQILLKSVDDVELYER
ncbi:MAG: hypothetical protein ACXVB9_17640 [Bdellovibrionota bacterium]